MPRNHRVRILTKPFDQRVASPLTTKLPQTIGHFGPDAGIPVVEVRRKSADDLRAIQPIEYPSQQSGSPKPRFHRLSSVTQRRNQAPNHVGISPAQFLFCPVRRRAIAPEICDIPVR